MLYNLRTLEFLLLSINKQTNNNKKKTTEEKCNMRRGKQQTQIQLIIHTN